MADLEKKCQHAEQVEAKLKEAIETLDTRVQLKLMDMILRGEIE